MTNLLHAQAPIRRGLFLHGYDSNGDAWVNSGTPTALYNEGTFNFVETPDHPNLANFSNLDDVLNPYLNGAQNDDWIFIGHSFGGMIAKYLEADVRGLSFPPLVEGMSMPNVTDLNSLKGVLTLGSPFQGAPMADNLAIAEGILTQFQTDILDAPEWEVTEGSGVISDLLLSTNWGDQPLYETFSNYLGLAHTTLTDMIEEGIGLGAQGAIGSGGFFIESLNAIPTVTPHLSISGVESFPASMRFASTMDDITDGFFENEVEAVELFEDLRTAYSYSYIYHDVELIAWYALQALYPDWLIEEIYEIDLDEEINRNIEGKLRWSDGRNALSDIDNRWASLHNGDVFVTVRYEPVQIWITCCEDSGEPPGSTADVEELEDLFYAVRPGDGGCEGCWQTFYNEYYTYTADKSDGFIPVNRTRWKSTDSQIWGGTLASNGANVTSQNIYFDGAGEADGGYNHSELRNLTRDYGQNGISKPMAYGRQWMRKRLGFLCGVRPIRFI